MCIIGGGGCFLHSIRRYEVTYHCIAAFGTYFSFIQHIRRSTAQSNWLLYSAELAPLT